MSLRLEKAGIMHLEILTGLSRTTFIDAFEAQNNPEDFKDYLEKAFHPDVIRKELENPDSEFYLVYDEEFLVGYFKMNQAGAQTDIKEITALELERIYVQKEFQGRKIGWWMLGKIRDLGISMGKEYLWLGVWKKNLGAIALYEKFGFRKFGTHPYFIGKDEQTDWLMRLDLVTLDQH
jgi:ribosomal protein S18 acetylase RimI-like enzyme